MQAVFEARHTDIAVRLDGVLDDPAWEKCPAYPLAALPGGGVEPFTEARESGEARLAWDDRFVYVGVRFTDSDVVAEGESDQEHHDQKGDVLEVFLKPESNTCYWELYATPHSRKTSFFFPGRGRLGLPSMEEYRCDLRVGAKVDGTLNRWQDRDNGWTAEMAVPIAALIEHGDTVGPDAAWSVLIARYNYSRYLSTKELSCAPGMPTAKMGYHTLDEYARLVFVK
jgi:hypothetical protein